ncbi:MAG TPA: HAMP domain-containing sensor histidine kinase [Gaiellaceae bacterium]|nr:HAMP domain-containing sensor histidine kinase [Gaiellaceae bacterium]
MTAGLDNDRLAVLVHEVRSPVAALAGVAETAAESRGESEALPTLVRLALAACRAIERIVMDVAVASVRVEPVDVSALVRDAVAAQGRGADVALVVDEGLSVEGDAVRLRQVVDNLIANALVHGGASEVAVHASRSEGAVHVAVSDAGPGIATEHLAGIFDAGVRLDADAPGSGLGLALSRAIAEAHGGSLTARSAPGEGATFTLALPVVLDQPDTAASNS